MALTQAKITPNNIGQRPYFRIVVRRFFLIWRYFRKLKLGKSATSQLPLQTEACHTEGEVLSLLSPHD